MTNVKSSFLPGWGFSGSIWTLFVNESSNNKYINLPLEINFNEDDLYHKLAYELAKQDRVYAWSLSCLLVFKLMQKGILKDQEIFLFAPAFKLNMSDQKKAHL